MIKFLFYNFVTVNSQQSTVNSQQSTVNSQQSTVNFNFKLYLELCLLYLFNKIIFNKIIFKIIFYAVEKFINYSIGYLSKFLYKSLSSKNNGFNEALFKYIF